MLKKINAELCDFSGYLNEKESVIIPTCECPVFCLIVETLYVILYK